MSDVIESNLMEPTPRRRAATPETLKMVRIQLEENDRIPPTGLPIGLNGRLAILRAGEEVDVPRWVLDVLDDAVMTVAVTDNGGQILEQRNRMAYPYRVVRGG